MNPIEKKSVHGLLLVDKPAGLTSNAVLQRVKKLFYAQKAGHTGSLDPFATGMLPICFGEATKFGQYLLDANKCYQATGCLGIKTDTSDYTGNVVARSAHVSITQAQLETVLQQFLGTTTQTPSMFSALKHQGVPLYRLARQGQIVERAERNIVIEDLALLHFDGQIFAIRVQCSKGTYIRNLVEDIGERLGVFAHTIKLHREYTVGLKEVPMYTLDVLEQCSEVERLTLLLPVDRAIDRLPIVTLEENDITALKQGRYVGYFSDDIGVIRLYDNHSNFHGVGFIKDNILYPKRLLAM